MERAVNNFVNGLRRSEVTPNKNEISNRQSISGTPIQKNFSNNKLRNSESPFARSSIFHPMQQNSHVFNSSSQQKLPLNRHSSYIHESNPFPDLFPRQKIQNSVSQSPISNLERNNIFFSQQKDEPSAPGIQQQLSNLEQKTTSISNSMNCFGILSSQSSSISSVGSVQNNQMATEPAQKIDSYPEVLKERFNELPQSGSQMIHARRTGGGAGDILNKELQNQISDLQNLRENLFSSNQNAEFTFSASKVNPEHPISNAFSDKQRNYLQERNSMDSQKKVEILPVCLQQNQSDVLPPVTNNFANIIREVEANPAGIFKNVSNDHHRESNWQGHSKNNHQEPTTSHNLIASDYQMKEQNNSIFEVKSQLEREIIKENQQTNQEPVVISESSINQQEISRNLAAVKNLNNDFIHTENCMSHKFTLLSSGAQGSHSNNFHAFLGITDEKSKNQHQNSGEDKSRGNFSNVFRKTDSQTMNGVEDSIAKIQSFSPCEQVQSSSSARNENKFIYSQSLKHSDQASVSDGIKKTAEFQRENNESSENKPQQIENYVVQSQDNENRNSSSVVPIYMANSTDENERKSFSFSENYFRNQNMDISASFSQIKEKQLDFPVDAQPQDTCSFAQQYLSSPEIVEKFLSFKRDVKFENEQLRIQQILLTELSREEESEQSQMEIFNRNNEQSGDLLIEIPLTKQSEETLETIEEAKNQLEKAIQMVVDQDDKERLEFTRGVISLFQQKYGADIFERAQEVAVSLQKDSVRVNQKKGLGGRKRNLEEAASDSGMNSQLLEDKSYRSQLRSAIQSQNEDGISVGSEESHNIPINKKQNKQKSQN